MSSPAILKATLFNTKITIHGEDHSNIDNKYYEKLKLTGVLFVEHSTNACELKPSEIHLFEKYAKGTEWVFYTQKKIGNENVVCFDTRSEQGYLTALQEKQMIELSGTLIDGDPADIRLFIDLAMTSMNTLSNNRIVFDEDYFVESFDMLKGQMEAIIKLLKIRKAKGADTKVLDMPLEQLLPGLASTFATNLRRIASVSVDLYLMFKIIEYVKRDTPEIQIFCGKNHLIRISKMLPLTNVKVTRITKQLEEYSRVEMDGNKDIDEQINAL